MTTTSAPETKVYSAATATRLYTDESREDIWDYLTRFLTRNDPPTFVNLASSFKQIDDGPISAGTTFKGVSSQGNPKYAKITLWRPVEEFGFEEQSPTRWDRPELSIPFSWSRMDFSLQDHPEGTLVVITRRERADSHKTKRRLLPEWLDSEPRLNPYRAPAVLGYLFSSGYGYHGKPKVADEFLIEDAPSLRQNW